MSNRQAISGRSSVLGLAVLAALAVLASTAGCAGAGAGPVTVAEVIDGDTIAVRFAGQTETVRLVGIDTPETVHPTKPIECYGPEASGHLRELLPEGTEVRLERDTELRDQYGRMLLYVHRGDGLFVNLAMVDAGMAETLHIDPNNAYRKPLDAAQRQAKANRTGLWSTCR